MVTSFNAGFICLQGTLEEKVFQRQVSKQGLSGVVVDAKSSNFSPSFSPEELKVPTLTPLLQKWRKFSPFVETNVGTMKLMRC